MEHGAGCMVVRNIEDVDRYVGLVRDAAAKIQTVGFHPIQGHALNVVVQINQTWTYVSLP
jgi:hypothetical protein